MATQAEESFGFVVSTPAWLREQVEASGPLFGRHHLAVAAYDYNELERFVRSAKGVIERLGTT